MKVLKIKGNYSEGKGDGEQGLKMSLVTDSSILYSNKPFFIPDFAESFVIYTGLAVRINRLGKNIAARFAARYYDAVAACVMVEAQNRNSLLTPCDARLTAFDGAVMLGDFMTLEKKENVKDVHIDTFINDEKIQTFGSPSMRIDIDHLIEIASRHFTLKMGDVIVSGNFNASHEIAIGERLISTVNGEESLKIRIK